MAVIDHIFVFIMEIFICPFYSNRSIDLTVDNSEYKLRFFFFETGRNSDNISCEIYNFCDDILIFIIIRNLTIFTQCEFSGKVLEFLRDSWNGSEKVSEKFWTNSNLSDNWIFEYSLEMLRHISISKYRNKNWKLHKKIFETQNFFPKMARSFCEKCSDHTLSPNNNLVKIKSFIPYNFSTI